MAEIIIADITCHDGYSPRVVNFATQGFVVGAAPIVDPTLDSRITVARAGTATRINASGLIESVGANLPRFDYNQITRAIKALLAEETRTNYVRNSDLT
ncbi:MAG TPA: hypothetical protein VGD52_26310, partial [Pseudoduganella sp.]